MIRSQRDLDKVRENLAVEREVQECRQRWRPVGLRSTITIAESWTTGISFLGCSKRAIIEKMRESPDGYGADWEGFRGAMDKAARIEAELAEEIKRRISEECLRPQ
jgi:hypothetical protein